MDTDQVIEKIQKQQSHDMLFAGGFFAILIICGLIGVEWYWTSMIAMCMGLRINAAVNKNLNIKYMKLLQRQNAVIEYLTATVDQQTANLDIAVDLGEPSNGSSPYVLQLPPKNKKGMQ